MGYLRDGQTRPEWRGCTHEQWDHDRCTDCRIRRIDYAPDKTKHYVALPVGHMVAPAFHTLAGMGTLTDHKTWVTRSIK